VGVKFRGGPNQTSVEKGGDELWIAEKFQSNSEIAGSPRNSFRASLVLRLPGGRALNGLGGHKAYRTLSNFEYQIIDVRESDVGDKFHGQKGNSPDRPLRSQSAC
jgi:hypothetical protein